MHMDNIGGDELVSVNILQEAILADPIIEQLSNTGTWVFNIEKHTLSFSIHALKMLLLTPSETLKNDFFHQISNDDKKRFDQFLLSLSNSTGSISLEFSITKEKEQAKETNQFVIKGNKSENNLIYGIIYPASPHQKTIDDLLKAKEKAEESNQLKSSFLSNVSHAIRTPMNSILGFTELINIGQLAPDKRKSFMEIIKTKGNQLLNLIDDIAEIAKFETGKITVQNTQVELNRVLAELKYETEDDRQKLNKENIGILLSIPPEHSNLTIYTDSGRLSQILSNLLNNALKFTEKGYVEFGYMVKDTRFLQFYVKDTGMGIPKDKQKGIFAPFRKIEDISNRRTMTSGLGLTLAKGFVEILGGKIWVESESGKGSIFYFTLPMVIPQIIDEEQFKENDSRKGYNWKNKVILVVEDEEINFKFLEAVLDKTDAKIIHAQTGLQAIELTKTLPRIDLILMDIKLPEMSGFEATTEIKKLKSKLPIIAQTAYSLQEDRDKCIASGCDDYVVKPIDIDLLFEKLNHFLAN